MAEDFNYSASVSADMGDFIQSMKDAKDIMDRLETSSELLDNAISKDLAEGIRRIIPSGNKLEQMFKAGGSEAVEASKQIKVYAQALEQAARKGADFLAGSSLGSRMGLRTGGEKEQDRQYVEDQKAHQASIKAKIAQEKAFIDDVKRFAKEYRDSQLGAVKEVTDASIDSAERRINAIRDEVEVNSRAAQEQATEAILRASAEEAAYRQAEDAKLAHLEAFRLEGQTLQDVQREHEAYMNTVSNTRYALYDVATTMTMISGLTLGATGAGMGLAASYERAFADVARVSGGTREEVAALERELLDLNKVVPESFNEIAKVATLGGQMNIPVQALSEFTDTVLMFSSATGVSVEKTASSLGRLAQMTGTATDELENLGSSVYHVGINSVATEDQILTVAEQISATANLAGFANHEIVGLASAMASLGIAPQMARGASLRVFRNISDAVDEAGEDLDQFASVAKMSAEEFAQAWQTSPAQAFGALINGMGDVADAGGNLASVLRDLGITQTQDSQVMLMLAQNTDVYANALDNAASAYSQGTALQEGFAHTAGTLVERLKTLWNVLKVTVVEGMGPLFRILGAILTPIEALANGFEKIVSTKIGQFLFSTAAGAAGLVGSVALGAAVLSRMGGAFLGILRSVVDVNAAFRMTSANTTQMGRAIGITTAELSKNTASVSANAKAWMQLNLSKAGVVENFNRSRASAVALGGTLLRSITTIGAITLAVQGLTKAWDYFSGAAEKRRIDELFGGAGLQEAISKDTAALKEGAAAYSTFTAEVTTSSQHLPEWASQLESSAGSQDVLGESVKDTTEAIREQTMAMGDNYREAMLESLVVDENVQEVFKKHGDALRQAGFSLAEAITAGLEEPGDGATRYVDNIIEGLREQESRLTAEMNSLQMQGINADEAEIARIAGEISLLNDQLAAMGKIRKEMASSDTQIINDQDLYKAQEAIAASGELGNAWREAGDEAEIAADKVVDFTDSLFDVALGQADATEGLWKLIDGLQSTDDAFDITTEGGIQNMRNLEAVVNQASVNAAGDANAYMASLLQIYDALEFVGVEGSAEIDFLGQHLAAVFNETWGLSLNVNPARASAQAVLADMIAVLEAKAAIENTRPPRIGATPGPSGTTMFQRAMGIGPTGEQKAIQNQISSLKALQNQLSRNTAEAVKYGNSAEKAHNRAARGAGRGAGANRKAADSAKKAAEEVRTFADYAADLNSVMSRASEIRFGLLNAQDAVAESIQRMKDRFIEAEKAVRDARASIRDLQADLGILAADKSKLEYHLSIAIEYGDTKRAEQIQADLAKIDADMAGKTDDLADARRDLTKAQDANTKSLTGNTEGSRRNREEVQALAQAYVEEILQMASAGASQEELERRSRELRAEFEKQVTQLGFNQKEIGKFSKTFDDLTTVIKNVPTNVTVKANANPAIQAFNEFAAKSKSKVDEVDKKLKNFSNKKYGGPSIGAPRISGGANWNAILNSMVAAYAASKDFQQAVVSALRYSRGTQSRAAIERNLINSYRAQSRRTLGFQHGGLIPEPDGNYGRMGTDRTPIMATPGEYMMPTKSVRYYGVPFMNAIRDLKLPKSGYGGGGAGPINVRTNVDAVSLTAGSIQAIAQAVQPYLVVGNKVIQQANGSADRRSTRVGAY